MKSQHSPIVKIAIPDKQFLNRIKTHFATSFKVEMCAECDEKVYQLLNHIRENTITEIIRDFDGRTKITIDGIEITIPELNTFPKAFVSYVLNINKEMRDAVSSIFIYLRWICDFVETNEKLHFGWSYFSLDNKTWLPLPGGIVMGAGSSHSVDFRITEVDKENINSLIAKGDVEPVYHSLFREAWNLQHSNPRSSFIIAISSIEIAAKNLIEKAVPDSAWLVRNIPSPPIEKIIRKYFPLLPSPNKIDGKVLVPPRSMINKLEKKWVPQRNGLIHLGKDAVRGAELKEMLLCIKDMLHIIDFNSGYDWGLSFIRSQTLEEIGIDTGRIAKR